MSNPNYTHIVMLVDASGSMEGTKADTILGINNFVESQKKLTEDQDRNLSFDQDLGDSKPVFKCTGTLIFFNSGSGYYNTMTTILNNGEPGESYNFTKLYDCADLNTVPQLTDQNYTPHGGTPLIDAFCKAISECSALVAMMPEQERPGRVIFLSITDGQENASTKFKEAELKTMVEEKQAMNWQFIYLGANQDAISESRSYGVAAGQSLTYNATSAGYSQMFDMATHNVSMKRSVEPSHMFSQMISSPEMDHNAIGSIDQITTTGDALDNVNGWLGDSSLITGKDPDTSMTIKKGPDNKGI